MDSIKGVFWMFIICTAGVHCFEPCKNDWKTTKNLLCLHQNKGFGGKKVWESIMKGSYSPNTTVWLNGLVLRSPVMEYYGCFYIKFEIGSEKLVEKNRFINCSKTCEKEVINKDGVFIALKGNACYCFKQSDNMVYVSSIKCSGSEYENSNNKHGDLYNVYKFTDHKPNEMVGMNCFSKPKPSQPIRSTNCNALLKFKCQGAVDPSPVYTECTTYLTYEDAFNTCQHNNMYINSESGKYDDEEIWSSAHAEETVLWDPDADFDFDENIYQCLLAEYSTIHKKYTLKAKSCTKKYQGICLISKDPTPRPNTSITSDEMVGMNCFSKPKASQPIRSTSCSALLKFKCQSAADASPVYTECTTYLTYEDALNTCQQHNMYINSESGKCDDEETWSSTHAEETVLWDQDADFDFDENIYKCLLAEYSTILKNYTLKAESCTNKYNGICLFQSEDPTTRPNTLMPSEYSSPSSVNDLFDSRDEGNHKDNTGMVIGIIFGIVLSLGLTIAGIICWRRRSRHTSVTRTTGSLYYSTVQSDELSDQQLTTPRDYNDTEQPPHLTNTEEGHYNHLGDDELQQNLSGGPVYDHSGMDMNLYDSSATHGRQSADLHGVYDCNQCTSEYSVMNDKKKLTSPDDTYDHT